MGLIKQFALDIRRQDRADVTAGAEPSARRIRDAVTALRSLFGRQIEQRLYRHAYTAFGFDRCRTFDAIVTSV